MTSVLRHIIDHCSHHKSRTPVLDCIDYLMKRTLSLNSVSTCSSSSHCFISYIFQSSPWHIWYFWKLKRKNIWLHNICLFWVTQIFLEVFLHKGGKKERIWYKTKGRLIVICIQTVMKALDTLKGSKSKDMFDIDARLFFLK